MWNVVVRKAGMSIVDSLKSIVGVGDPGVSFTPYRCDDCGHGFESAKTPERVQCPECLSREISEA